MKKELVGYVAGMVNDMNRNTKYIVEKEYSHDAISLSKQYSLSLDDLQEYIIDMPEESTDVAEDTARYINRIQELEDTNRELEIRNSNQKATIQAKSYTNYKLQELERQLAESEEALTNMMDNESKLNLRVENAELMINVWHETCDSLARKNEKLRGDN